MSKKLNKLNLSDIWYDAAGLMKKNPQILFPLTIIAFLEALWLELLYFAPHAPLKYVFMPPIRRFSVRSALIIQPIYFNCRNFLVLDK